MSADPSSIIGADQVDKSANLFHGRAAGPVIQARDIGGITVQQRPICRRWRRCSRMG
ncbi:hypothetical protein [Actinomadura litoris]|uniref:Uncharacterized protein n=1 Tax=Actinomadura litoris TaxID=2678616 RepID=A0A7K1LB79_9ACTN|nr:hypothetical protein [Actinomadura litoris]MUN41678.1 hypothetical protein [Actinomadura litoris]